jgi:hypothetical protein
MPIPGLTAGRLAKGAFNTFLAVGSVNATRDRMRQGQNPVFAAVTEGAMFAANFVLPVAGQLALFAGLPLVRATAAIVTDQVSQHNNFVRTARTPFSHRFEHTDVTSRAQALGLRSIGAAWGHAQMGSEASMMARRYGR